MDNAHDARVIDVLDQRLKHFGLTGRKSRHFSQFQIPPAVHHTVLEVHVIVI